MSDQLTGSNTDKQLKGTFSYQQRILLQNHCLQLLVLLLLETLTKRPSGSIFPLTSLQKWVAWRETLPWDTMPGKIIYPAVATKLG